MIKRLLSFNIISAILGILVFVIHGYVLSNLDTVLSYSLAGAYVFFQLYFTLFSVVIEIVNRISSSNVGYFYLFTFLIKLLVFGLKYQDILLAPEAPALSGRISLLIPMLIYVAFEAFYAIKLVLPIDKQQPSDLSE
ncbi:DUF6168 family protein [Fulvivirga lutea]|uniref:Uncharacterized protein n=1 Tax=Fulvivirga lutea TaxID=2810512 RepID=A0A974WJH2_9BACT|nr:DUF6168 family protein [Fulvivirga lutea]QSE98347.1 hypothetical protein JR347_04525 [Fulvivirga lutea]